MEDEAVSAQKVAAYEKARKKKVDALVKEAKLRGGQVRVDLKYALEHGEWPENAMCPDCGSFTRIVNNKRKCNNCKWSA